MKFEYERNNHSVGNSIWHMEWCPKYRYEMFRKFKYKNLVAACIRKAATEYNIKILILNVMPEHMHTIVKLPLTRTPAKALQLLKGKSAYIFFRVHPKARLRYPKGHLWSRGKFASRALVILIFLQLCVISYIRKSTMAQPSQETPYFSVERTCHFTGNFL